MFLCLSNKTTLKFLFSNNDFFRIYYSCSCWHWEDSDQDWMSDSTYFHHSADTLGELYYKFFEDNDNVEKHQQPVLLTTT